jgi:hypothetical protein
LPAACSSNTSEVLPGADDRADDGDPVEHGFEDRELDLVVGWQGDEHQRTAAPQRRVGLLECTWRYGKRDRLIHTAESLDRLDRVLFFGVDRELCAQLTRELELLIDHVDRDYMPSGECHVLDRKVSQAADAEYGNEIGRAGACDLTALYVVTPAQVSGAASNESTPSGTLTTYWA